MRLSKEQRIFTRHIGLLIEKAYCLGLELTFGEAWRSNEEQLRLKKAGLSQIDYGQHQKRLAVDFNLFKDGKLTWKWEDYVPLGEYWHSLDEKNRWGGDWNKNGKKDGFIDAPHFERNV